MRDWMIAAALGIVAMALLWTWTSKNAACTTGIVETRSALAASDDEMQKLTGADQALKCAVYRKRVSVLTEATPIAYACGPPQATKASARPQLDSELSFYKRLVAEQCEAPR